MTISREDSNKINYKPSVEWYKERMYKTAYGEEQLYKKYQPDIEVVDPEVLLKKYEDLTKKAKKLDGALDALAMALKIPVDKEKQPRVSYALTIIDPSSGGEYVSYIVYKELLAQAEAGKKNLDLMFLLENSTADRYSNSDMISYRYAIGSQAVNTGEMVQSPDHASKAAFKGYDSDMLSTISDWSENEFHVRQIMDFVNNFINTTPDPMYIPWNFKPDARRKMVEYEDIGTFLTQYTDLTDGLSDSVDLLPNTPLSLTRDLWDALNYKGDSDNNFFNKINDVLGFNYTSDLVCCFASWSHGLDLKTLKALRMVLAIVANGIGADYGKLLNSLLGIIENLFKNLIFSQLIKIIDMIFQMITRPIREWLNTNDDKWKRIFLCTPIDELINTYVLGGLQYLEDWLVSKIIDWFKTMEIDMYFESCKVGLVGKNKKLQLLIEILDSVIETMGRLSFCGLENSPMQDKVTRFIEGYKIGPDWNYTYPPEEHPNMYNSFEKTQVVVAEKDGEITETKETFYQMQIKTEKLEVTEDMIDTCLKRVAEEDVFSVQKWMEDLNSNTTEDINV